MVGIRNFIDMSLHNYLDTTKISHIIAIVIVLSLLMSYVLTLSISAAVVPEMVTVESSYDLVIGVSSYICNVVTINLLYWTTYYYVPPDTVTDITNWIDRLYGYERYHHIVHWHTDF